MKKEQFNQQSKINEAEYAATVAEKESKQKFERDLAGRKKEMQAELKPLQKELAGKVDELERTDL